MRRKMAQAGGSSAKRKEMQLPADEYQKSAADSGTENEKEIEVIR